MTNTDPAPLAHPPLIVGIAGGSGSGKSTVAKALRQRLGEERAAIIAHDLYYHDHGDARVEALQHLNFDRPDSLDNTLLTEHLAALRRGHAVELPVYDFSTHQRGAGTRRLEAAPVILLEGMLVLAVEAIRALLDFKVYVDTEADLRFIRRLKRDMRDRGRTPISVIEQYLATVRPMHVAHVEPSRLHADAVIHEGGKNELAIAELSGRIAALLAAR